MKTSQQIYFDKIRTNFVNCHDPKEFWILVKKLLQKIKLSKQLGLDQRQHF